jgi:sterol desaturase/sphingolipid hydroxylase (fatty acid hydroxylase superfamily)
MGGRGLAGSFKRQGLAVGHPRSMTPAVVRTMFLPAMFLLATAGCGLVATGLPEPTIGIVVLLAIAVSFVAERLAPYNEDWNEPLGDRWRDVAHAVVNEGSLLLALLALPALGDALVLVEVWPSEWPLVSQVLLAIVLADLGITLAHWTSHRIGWLWRLHAVHHSVRRFYGFNGLMKHPLHQTVELLAGITPLVLVGMPSRVAAALAVCVAVQLLLQHSNVDYATGGLHRLLALNRPHRFHHVAAGGEGDVNFGLFTTIWDRWPLRSHRSGTRAFRTGDIGVAGRPDYPSRYVDQLVEPFRAHTS